MGVFDFERWEAAQRRKLEEIIKEVESYSLMEAVIHWFPLPLSGLRIARQINGVMFTAIDDKEQRFSILYKRKVPTVDIVCRDINRVFGAWIHNECYSLSFALSVAEETTENAVLKVSVFPGLDFEDVDDLLKVDEDAAVKVFTGSEGGALNLSCPVCGFFCTHVRSAYARTGCDEHEGGGGYCGVEARGRTDDRRDALCIGVEGECGHNFNIVFQQHKGVEFIEVKVSKKDLLQQCEIPTARGRTND